MAAGGKFVNPDTGEAVVVPLQFVDNSGGDGGTQTVDWNAFTQASQGGLIGHDEEGRAFVKDLPAGTPVELARAIDDNTSPHYTYNGQPLMRFEDATVQAMMPMYRQIAAQYGINNLDDYLMQLPPGVVEGKVGQRSIGSPGGWYLPHQLGMLFAQNLQSEGFIDKLGPAAVFLPFLLTAGAGILPALAAQTGATGSFATGLAGAGQGLFLSGGDPVAALAGGVTGGLGDAVVDGAQSAFDTISSEIHPIAGKVAEGAIKGGLSGIVSGDPLGGAVRGGLFSGLGEGISTGLDALSPASGVELAPESIQASEAPFSDFDIPGVGASDLQALAKPDTGVAPAAPAPDVSEFSIPGVSAADLQGLLKPEIDPGLFSTILGGEESARLPSPTVTAIEPQDFEGTFSDEEEAAAQQDVSDATAGERYGRLAKTVFGIYEDLFGEAPKVPEYKAPEQSEDESDEQYHGRVVEDALQYIDIEGLSVESLAKQGLTPGSPQYLDAVLAEIDSIIEQIFGFNPAALEEGESVEDLQGALRGKTDLESQALLRALYARGALGSLTGAGRGIDPFTGQLQEFGTDEFVSGPTAAHQRGIAQFGSELAGADTAGAARGLFDEFLQRDPDLFGARASAEKRRDRDRKIAALSAALGTKKRGSRDEDELLALLQQIYGRGLFSEA